MAYTRPTGPHVTEAAGHGMGETHHIRPTLFTMASTTPADTPLRHAGMRLSGMPADGLAPRSLNIPFQVCLGLSGLRAPVSRGVSSVSSRTLKNNVGYAGWYRKTSRATRGRRSRRSP
ncbi:hypothetical protein NSPZN2_30395 [Nitrospira defluvii]|uniref:Uncharacterized protein n=1 Tax=Nitrospira defluvii TaxID=330214 RepID=A0ABM8RJ12_9BACT|nr:hypothetical protein NSPZN2_30395 [Nitrospira defluvii]